MHLYLTYEFSARIGKQELVTSMQLEISPEKEVAFWDNPELLYNQISTSIIGALNLPSDCNAKVRCIEKRISKARILDEPKITICNAT